MNGALPANIEAERAILGGILLDNSAIQETADLTPEDFALDSHRRIFRRIRDLAADQKPIDSVTLYEELNRHGELEGIGGPAYIALLVDALPDRPSIAHYVKMVRDKALLRGVICAGNAAIARAEQGDTPAELLADHAASIALLTARATVNGDETLGHSYEELMNAPPVNFAIEGFLQEQGVTLIGGLSGHGKTLIMLAMARALLESGKLFHRFAVNTPSTKVIYLIPECGISPFASRLKMFRLGDYVRDGRLIVRTLSKKPIALTSPVLLDKVPGADIFLDTAVRFKSGDENDASDNNEFAESLFNLQRLGARTITGAHHAPKGFGKDTVMTLENILRGTGDIGAMLCTCWGIRQIDADQNRIFIQNVKPRDFQPCQPFIIQGRPSLDETGYFELTEPPGYAGELSDHLSADKGGRPEIGDSKKASAYVLHEGGRSQRQIADALKVSLGTVNGWLQEKSNRGCSKTC